MKDHGREKKPQRSRGQKAPVDQEGEEEMATHVELPFVFEPTPREQQESRTFRLCVELIKEDDGRWSASVPILPGCATWGKTREDSLQNIQDAAKAYIQDMLANEEEIPEAEMEVITVTLP